MARRVLVVDDNRELAENIAEILEGEGYEATVSVDPREALERAAEIDFDVALLDVRMPGMDGVTLYEELREVRPQARYLLMTAFTADQRICDALDAGVRTIFPKPVPIDNLLRHLDRPQEGRPLLLVEDDDDLAFDLKELLAERGYDVRRYCEIAAVREALGELEPGGAILDVRLPDGDGAELARELCATIPGLAVVLITGYDPEEAAAIVRGSCEDNCRILTKPFAPDRLLTTLRTLGATPSSRAS
ncbi:MAG: response regulator [Polyangiales bacterium]